jgi:RING finger protein 113A
MKYLFSIVENSLHRFRDQSSMSSTSAVNVPFFRRGKTRPTTSRKRSASPPVATAPIQSTSKSQVVLPSRKAQGNLLSAGTKRTAAQRDEGEEDSRDGPDVKWTSAGSHVDAALQILAGDEAEELLAKRLKKERVDRGAEDEEIPEDGQYRGQKAYKSHIKKSTEVPKSMRVGPQRSTSTIRTVTIVDYQPDVCKDYKGTSSSRCHSCLNPNINLQRLAIAGSVILVNFCTTAEHVSPTLARI